jgi:predicted nucleic acid-binding protein
VRLLADTNIYLELLLAQARELEAKGFLENASQHALFISDFSLHSIGPLLLRRKKPDVLRQFVDDIFVKSGVRLMGLSGVEMHAVADAAAAFRLDFDDAYQYAIAAKYGLTIVSFDGEFDRTPRGRKQPSEIPS